jgi:ribosome-binding factor A
VTDYDYNHHRVSLDNNDRSRNTATALDGYPLDIQPDGSWPGLDANPREQRFDKQAMLDVADKIDRLISDVGTIDLSSAASVSFGPDSWQAAVYLRQASGQVAHAVSEYSQELIRNLQAAAQAIRTAAGTYGTAESANAASANAVDQNLAANPAPSGPSPAAW